MRIQLESLNPCFNGRYSQSNLKGSAWTGCLIVLILVLMEDTLRGNAFVNHRGDFSKS